MDNPEQLTIEELYENEKRRRQKAEDDLQKAKDATQKAKDATQKAKDDTQKAKDILKTERNRRQKAEDVTEGAMKVHRPTTIPELLAQYHAKSLDVKIGADGLARGVVSNPVGRKYPKLITSWKNFASDQQKIWNTIRASSTYSNQLFNSSSMTKAITLEHIRSELDLVIIDDLIVLKPVMAILNRLFEEEEELRKQLKLQGNVEFRRSLVSSTICDATKAPRHPEEVSAQADAFFITDRHRYSIEYNLLFKFSEAEIVPGLHGDISPDQEVINNDDTSSEATSRRLITVVITQLYSCLLEAGISYGYITTGSMMIFLHVLDNPAHVEYHVWNPQDFDFDDSAFIHNTAIAEVVAFSIQAMQAHPQPQQWGRAVAELEIWPQEYDQLPDYTPKTNREDSTESDTPVYKPGPEADLFSRSSPVVGGAGKKGKGDGGKTAGDSIGNHRKRVREREYCSLSCLLGLTKGGHLDLDCPNIADHGKRHLTQLEFLGLVREQLARDRGSVTDCEPLWISGSVGAMFKVTLTSHGYTVIAKGVRLHDVPHLKNEAKIYHHLRSIQGIHIPVCLGAINLVHPYYHMADEFVRFLFQSYAGVSVRQTMKEENRADILSNLTNAMNAIHRLRVLHCDPMLRNIMMDEKSGAVQIIDFERARIYGKEKEVASSSRKKKLPRGARLTNEKVIPPPSSSSKTPMVEQAAGQNCEEVMMTQEDILFKKELRAARYEIAMC